MNDTIFDCLLEGNIKIVVSIACKKALINSENPSFNPIQKACSSFQVATCDSRYYSESRQRSCIVPKADYNNYTIEKVNQRQKRKGKQEQRF